MTPDLGDLERKVFDYARDMITEIGQAPTLQEISERFGLFSRTVARRAVDDIVSAGWLERTNDRERNLALPADAVAVDLTMVATGALQAELSRRDRPHQLPRRSLTRFTRACGAPCCENRVQRGHLLCLYHWRALPVHLRDELVTSHRFANEPAFADAWRRATDILEVARHG